MLTRCICILLHAISIVLQLLPEMTLQLTQQREKVGSWHSGQLGGIEVSGGGRSRLYIRTCPRLHSEDILPSCVFKIIDADLKDKLSCTGDFSKVWSPESQPWFIVL